VISSNTRLNEKAQAMVSQLQQVEAQLHLSMESLHFDESEAKKIDFCKLYSVFAQIHCIQNTINTELCKEYPDILWTSRCIIGTQILYLHYTELLSNMLQGLAVMNPQDQ